MRLSIVSRLGILLIPFFIVAQVRVESPAEPRDTPQSISEHTVLINSQSYDWRQNPDANLSAPGARTVALASCPQGLLGKDEIYYIRSSTYFSVYISGTGTPEAAAVTGSTCKGDGRPGTLQFTTVNTHPNGYTIGSATGGIYEAGIAARIKTAGARYPVGEYQNGGYVRIGPGYITLYAALNITTLFQTIDFSGSTLICKFDADCINVVAPAAGVT